MAAPFRRIIIDERSRGSTMAERVVACLPGAEVVLVEDAREAGGGKPRKDTLVLMEHPGRFVKDFPRVPGAPPCGEKYIMSLLNCPFSCSYCYLQAYLELGDIVVFTNTEKMEEEVREALAGDAPRRVTTGEMGDSLALDHITGTTASLLPLFRDTETLLEVRTKSANVDHLLPEPDSGAGGRHPAAGDLSADGRCPSASNLPADAGFPAETDNPTDTGRGSPRLAPPDLENLLVTWTLSPKEAIKREEGGTAGLEERLEAIGKVSAAGIKIGVRFDPIIPYYYSRKAYADIVEKLSDAAENGVHRLELGVLRFPPGLWESVRVTRPASPLMRGEYHRDSEGKMRCYRPLRVEIYSEMNSILREAFPRAPVELSMEHESVWRQAGVSL